MSALSKMNVRAFGCFVALVLFCVSAVPFAQSSNGVDGETVDSTVSVAAPAMSANGLALAGLPSGAENVRFTSFGNLNREYQRLCPRMPSVQKWIVTV